MQLKLKRSQKTSGMMSKTVVFILDARADLTEEEKTNVQKYELGKDVIYSSEATKALKEAARLPGTGTLGMLARVAMSKLTLSITINSLCSGHQIDCKSLQEVLEAEEAVKEACALLRIYLTAAATFDGREEVIEY